MFLYHGLLLLLLHLDRLLLLDERLDYVSVTLDFVCDLEACGQLLGLLATAAVLKSP